MKFGYLIEPPFSFQLDDGTVTGCDVELAKAVLAEIGESDFQPVEAGFAELLPGLETGRWRMTTGLFATEDRKKKASFSRPIWALPDGLLVKKGNPKKLTGYLSIAEYDGVRLAVIRDQIQHDTALQLGVADQRIQIFETYAAAAEAVMGGNADAYASVARAHSAFIEQNPGFDLDFTLVPRGEREPAYGHFAFAKDDDAFGHSLDAALDAFIGSQKHRALVARFGFSGSDVDLAANWSR
jgi:polar amino acid transport system substrate-binding protein